MRKTTENKAPKRGGFNTYGQSATLKMEVNGAGSDIKDPKTRTKKAKRKFISQILTLALIEVAERENDFKFVKKCWGTYHCQNSVLYNAEKLHSTYCKNRFCLGCQGIRKAILIEKYYPVLSKWNGDLFFVTLTYPSCKEDELEMQIDHILGQFKRIINRYKRRHERGQGKRPRGLRSLESNFNPVSKTYNPHLHIIIEGRELAYGLRRDWIIANPCVNGDAQDVRMVGNLDKCLVEAIKYGSKIFTEPKSIRSGMKKRNAKIYARALYRILKAFEKRRLFAHFGFKVPEEYKNREKQTTVIKNGSMLTYMPSLKDWINTDTGSLLTNYEPEPELIDKLNTIDKNLC